MSSLVQAVLLAVSIAWIRPGTITQSTAPVVRSPAGTFTGNSSIIGLDLFLGIRYAKPPVGDLRFANPVPLERVDPNANISANSYGPACPQAKRYELYNGMSEDCLTLDIVRPPKRAGELFPVMFFIYGGGNTNGQSIMYNGTALVQHSIKIGHPVLYVVPNYRVGGFGFMVSSDFKAANLSNVGLNDQYLALKWVKSNIASFGGDPDKVMIFGESAGSANVWAHMHRASTHNETGKYFRAAIGQSGHPGSPKYPRAVPAEVGDPTFNHVLEMTNCSSANSSIQCLRTVPLDTLIPLITHYRGANFTLDDNWFKSDALHALIEDKFAHVPIIQGANLAEGAVLMDDIFDFPDRKVLTEMVAGTLKNNIPLAEKVVGAYFNTPNEDLGKDYIADPNVPDEYWKALAIYSDIWMHLGRRAFLKKASQSANTWGFHFLQNPPLSSWNLSYGYPGMSHEFYRRIGSAHGAELVYLFGEVTNLPDAVPRDGKVSALMMSAWIYFAHYMDPNGEGVPYWPKYNSSSNGQVMYIQDQGDSTCQSRDDNLRQVVYNAWNDAFEQLGEPRIY